MYYLNSYKHFKTRKQQKQTRPHKHMNFEHAQRKGGSTNNNTHINTHINNAICLSSLNKFNEFLKICLTIC